MVFNTSITGYQEILTDPSYCRQIVTLTYPHIGNVGANLEDEESAQVHASGLIVRDMPLLASNFRMNQTLPEYLKARNVVAISGVDTRKLTRLLREKGAQNGCIMVGDVDPVVALKQVQACPSMNGQDLAKVVTCLEPMVWSEGEWELGKGFRTPAAQGFNVVAYDFGVKRNILRMLTSRGCKVTLVPAQTPAEDVLSMRPDGVFLSNGPGDPEPCDYAVHAIQKILAARVPTYGICLGHQLLGLASARAL